MTENRNFAELLPRLFRRTFNLEFDLFPSLDQPGKHAFVIDDPDKLEYIFTVYGQEHESLALHVNFGVLENECCQQAFVRGAFLSGGSVTDPDKRYHLEIVTPHLKVSDETYSLLLELGFSPKQTQRSGSSILYFKQSDMIVDFLTVIGAPVNAMKIIEAKMEKEIRNGVNRRVNCDTANVAKTVDAALQQITVIEQLQASGMLETLPEKLQEAARLRMENPEASLSELAALASPPISKPAMNHRLHKLLEYGTGT